MQVDDQQKILEEIKKFKRETKLDFEFDTVQKSFGKTNDIQYQTTIFIIKYPSYFFRILHRNEFDNRYETIRYTSFPSRKLIVPNNRNVGIETLLNFFRGWLNDHVIIFLEQHIEETPFEKHKRKIKEKEFKNSFDIDYDDNEILSDENIKVLESKFKLLESELSKKYDLTHNQIKELEAINKQTVEYARKGVVKSDLANVWSTKINNFLMSYIGSKSLDIAFQFGADALKFIMENDEKILPIIQITPYWS